MNALFYPFHLCHERTLNGLLEDFEAIHFRDFMALQLTPMMGTTAFPDRMGDYFPELLNAGRIVQGHVVSGFMSAEIGDAVDRDLGDEQWRATFHHAISHNRRFQHGLFGSSHIPQPGTPTTDDHSILTELTQTYGMKTLYDVERVKALSRTAHTTEDGPRFEYGWALLKTSASLAYTIQLCQSLQLAAATDSSTHHQLLTTTCQRDGIHLTNTCLNREGY